MVVQIGTLTQEQALQHAQAASRGNMGALESVLRALVGGDISLDNLNVTTLSIGGTAIAATAAEINRTADNSARMVDLTAATLTIAMATHDKKIITFNKADGITVTLPAAAGTGLDVTMFVETTLTSNGVVQVANASDVMAGNVAMTTDAGGVVIPTAATSDTITMNGSTTGGLAGSWIRLVDVATNLWWVSGGLNSSGVEATPFSAAV